MVNLPRAALCSGAAMLFAGCGGSQLPTSAAASAAVAPGYMRVRFEAAGPLNFAKYQYLIIFNTSGNGLTPRLHDMLRIGMLTHSCWKRAVRTTVHTQLRLP